MPKRPGKTKGRLGAVARSDIWRALSTGHGAGRRSFGRGARLDDGFARLLRAGIEKRFERRIVDEAPLPDFHRFHAPIIDELVEFRSPDADELAGVIYRNAQRLQRTRGR